jgi:arylsulfatase A
MNRRLLIFFALIANILPGASQTTTRPNVLLIYSDDQGSIDLNCYGATDLHTPNLDKLASHGIRFTQFYAGSSVCSPSRAALMTGMSPQKAGLPGNTSSHEGDPGMPSDRITIAEMLKTAGYATAHIGKWHMGYTDDTEPLGQGFDYSFGHMGGCIDNYSHYFYWNGPNRHDLWENNTEVYRDGEYFPDLMVEKAKEFMLDHKDEAFFMYYAINLPHYPLQPTDKWRDYYKNLEMPRRDYAGFISVIDERVGELISILEELGIRDNTIIIFQSDQGHSCEIRAFGEGGNAGEFRGAKSSLFEGGIRVPAILNWPKHLPEGQVNDIPCINYDWFPTIAELCGVSEVPFEVEGKSLLPVIRQGDPQHEVFRWKLGRQWAVREGDWKLLGNPTDPSGKYPIRGEQDELFLVNLSADVNESINLASRYPDMVRELSEKYLAWEFASESDIPVKKAQLSNLAINSIITGTSPHPNYRAKGLNTLINNARGSGNINDGEWLGWEGKNYEGELLWKEAQQVQRISVRSLQDLGSWIFLPREVEIWVTDQRDKEIYIGKIQRPGDQEKNDYFIHSFDFVVGQKIKGIRLRITNQGNCPDWHAGHGGRAWLFLDEIIVE